MSEAEVEGQPLAAADVSDHDPPLAPGLYLVATPIGNLEDITLRALRTLRSVDRLACEDTRQTQKLLNHFGIRKPTVSYHLHNEHDRTEELLADLRRGGRIAVVSDAGTPGIADPGEAVVRAALEAGIPVFPVPGANAAINALIASGFPTGRFAFRAFLPAKAGQRRTVLEGLREVVTRDTTIGLATTQIFYEAPHRIVETLREVAAIFGASHRVVVARELTKLHEEFLRGTVEEVLAALEQRETVRGELVLLLSGELTSNSETGALQSSPGNAVAAAIRTGLSEKQALKDVAKARGMSKSEVFREWQRTRR